MEDLNGRATVRAATSGYLAPRVSGQAGGSLLPSISPDHWRVTDHGKPAQRAFKRTTAKTAGGKARPFTGRQRDFMADAEVPAHDAYVVDAEIRANPLPRSKTRAQDGLYALCVAWIGGACADRETWKGIEHGIARIAATDPAHASAWMRAMAPYRIA